MSFRNVTARYRPELPTVVLNVSIEVGAAGKDDGFCSKADEICITTDEFSLKLMNLY